MGSAASDRAAWGKLSPDGTRRQPLADHCRDVAAVFVGLLKLPGIGHRLAGLAGSPALLDAWIERLGWFAFLHDFGKVNAGFQARSDPAAPRIGHVAPIAAVPVEAYASLFPASIADWADLDTLHDLLDAMLSHHGRPWDPTRNYAVDAKYRRWWSKRGDYDPIAELVALRAAADRQFPAVSSEGVPPLSLPPRLIHALAGLVMLADWIASSDWQASPAASDLDAWASARLRTIGLDPAPLRSQLTAALPDFERAFGFAPRAAQRAFAEAEGPLAILESETGSGKTEAALWRFVTRFAAGAVDGLYFALPTRTAAVQLHQRVEDLVARLWPDDPPPVVLAVPGYLEDGGPGSLPNATDLLDAAEGDARIAPTWAGEHPKRYFAATISVGTIDQALLAVLRVKHAHLRAAALMRHMLVIDEVHASDAYMSRVVATLVADHLAAGGEAALLSATLGSVARQRLAAAPWCRNAADLVPPTLDEAIGAPYPAVTATTGRVVRVLPCRHDGRSKTVEISLLPAIDEADAVAHIALDAARAGAKVLVVRNTVADAVAVQQAVEAIADVGAAELFRVEGRATLHHGRFAREDRRRLDAAVEAALGKARPPGGLVLCGTQTLEQSLDIDADLLVTDLCPMDVLLQRIGRLHRHVREPDGGPRLRASGFETARAIVLTPADGLTPYLPGALPRGRARHGLGPVIRDGIPGGVYPDLRILEATRRLCEARPIWDIPAMNRDLVERATHEEALDRMIAEMPGAEGERWRSHGTSITGKALADATLGRLQTLDRTRPFMDDENRIVPDEFVRTRLGDAGPMIDLPPGTIGPFGTEIRRLVIPAWWHVGGETEGMRVAVRPGVVELAWDRTTLTYDRTGLSIG